MSLQYDAFISYRHAPLDMEMAKKVHTALETYHIPRSVQVKTGKKKMGRVFRDQEELPIGSDLDNNISSALASSDYLLVICSPRTPESYWVCKEIETFIEMHGRDHILAVLVEGEPDESFPKLLLTDDEGNPVEPLAADVRGEDPGERNRKFKTEKLRLAAPIIGCTYDDLKQRHRERMIRRTVTIVSVIAAVVAAAGTAFGIYSSNVASQMKQLADEKSELADEKTRLAEEILAEYKQKQENQSRFYAEESLSLLNAGNREDAVLVARAGLPDNDDGRPYVAEAENSLAKALYAYDSGTELKSDRMLPHEMSVGSVIRSTDREKLITIDTGNKVYVYDPKDWSVLLTIDPALKELNYTVNTIGADSDATGVYVATENGLTKYDMNGGIIFSNDDMRYVNGFKLDADGRIVMLATTDTLQMIDADTGKTVNVFENDAEYGFHAQKMCVEPESGICAMPHYDSEAPSTYVSMYDPGDGLIARCGVSEGYILASCTTPGGNIALLSCNSNFVSEMGLTSVCLELFSTDGTKLWSVPVDVDIRNWMTFETVMKAHSYPGADGETSEIVLTVEYDVFAFDESDGHMNCHVNARGNCMDLTVGLDSKYAYLSYLEGNVDAIDMATGEILTDPLIETDLDIINCVFVNGQVVLHPYMSSDLYVFSYHEATDLTELETFDQLMVTEGTAPDSSYYVLTPLGEPSKYLFYDTDGRLIHTYEGDMSFTAFTGFDKKQFIIGGPDDIVRIDPFSGDEQVTPRSALGEGADGTYGYLSGNGRYAVFWGSHSLCVSDIREMKSVASFESETVINKAIVSEDGEAIYVFSGTDPVYRIDTATGERHDPATDPGKFMARSESAHDQFMCLSHDGKMLAMFAMDGYVRIADTQSMTIMDEIPLSARIRMFIGFTDDDNYLVLQGDDGKLRIWDIAGKKYMSLTDTGTTINRLVCDYEDGLMAVMGGGELYLFETEGYGCKAYVPDGLAFLTGENKFLLGVKDQQMFMTGYKDYKSLLEEADRQFPGSGLDELRRVRYNIE